MIVRPLAETDLSEADRIMRDAFGTFIGLPEPRSFMGDADYVHSRWRSPAVECWGLELGGRLAGSNFATRWGNFGFFGPLSVDPAEQGKGGAQALMEPVIDAFARWDAGYQGLYTFSNSAKHLSLYGRYGFHPRFLTAIAAAPAATLGAARAPWRRLSEAAGIEREEILTEAAGIAGGVQDGLDLSDEIRACVDQSLGDVLLAPDGRAFALCHEGAGTEAGSGSVYIKFAAVQPGPGAAATFNDLLNATADLARERGAENVVAGVNAGCTAAWDAMFAAGFRALIVGVELRHGNQAGWSRPENFVLCDLR
jgi:GNAT superfamily N-acetyltransferase